MILTRGKKGQEYRTEQINLQENLLRRLEVLGLTEGTVISVVNKNFNGSMIIRVRGTRFAIGKKVAEGIFVREVKQK
ncbi:MAG: ferrous iron transport protein A [Clostridia bacterium]|nr:ferrous iron transport protein A [Clostridia bacterium]